MITVKNNVFHLATSHTSYVFMIDGRGMAEHLYYGPLLRHPEHDVDALVPKRSVPRQGEVSQSEKDWSTNPSDLPQEASFEGGGDFRTPFIAIDESRGCACGMDLRYRHSETFSGIRRISSGLPQAIGSEDEVHGLRLDFQDDLNDITVYDATGAATSTLFTNEQVTVAANLQNAVENPTTFYYGTRIGDDYYDWLTADGSGKNNRM